MDSNSQNNLTEADAKRVKPTLFIGLGGTGAQIMMRLRRRIVSEFWGKNRVRLDSIAEFPAARFLHIDLDQAELTGSKESGDTDPLRAAVKLLPTERVVENLDYPAYQKGGRLENFPHIRSFYPELALHDLQIDTSTGAGQIRAISRLYFYDKIDQIRSAVESHLRELQAGVSHQDALSRLGLETGSDRRVVVIASAAGGTGSGSFLDMGFFAKALNPDGPVELILLLPTGYSGANREATEANSYAALMELDACMSKSVRYVHPQYGWGPGKEDLLPGPKSLPYDAIFLADTKNMADVVTNTVDDVYHMMADILFEDFMPGDFADAKRSIDVNQKAHRALPHRQTLGDEGEGAVELYQLSYSSIGQCTMESPQNAERFARHLRESRDRVRALFQIVQDSQDITPGQKEVIAYLQSGALQVSTETDLDFSQALEEKKIPESAQDIVSSPPCSGELSFYVLIRELLGTENALDHTLLEYVNEKFATLLSSDDPEAKKEGVQAAKREILHEVEIVSGDKASGRRLRQLEDAGRKLANVLWNGVKQELYRRLDDRKRGGLDYVVALIKAVQGALSAPSTGIISKLQELAKQYQLLIELLLGDSGFNQAAERLAETRRGFFGGGEKKAAIIAEEMQVYLYWALRIKLMQKATEELAQIYAGVVDRLGKTIGADEQGNERYDGLLGELLENRGYVQETISLLESMVRRAEQQQKESYAMRIQLPVEEEIRHFDMEDPEAIQDWAENVFGVTGSEAIFSKLQTQSDRRSFINKMLDFSDAQDANIPNIRISDLLRKMDSAQRLEQFRQLMRRAAPWCGIRKGPNFMGLKSDNFTVIVSSGDTEFSKRYAEEMKQSLPSGLGVSSDRIQFPSLSSRSEQGKIVAYMRVDGFALDNIQDLKRWQTAYRQRSQKLPVHTSKLARYRHPVIPTPEEQRALRESRKTFYAAILLGVLEREPSEGIYLGIFEGSRLGCGTEVIRRNDPFGPDRLTEIQRQINRKRNTLETVAQRRAALVAWQYYLRAVYSRRPKGDGGGNDEEVKGLAHLYCEQIQRDWAALWGETDFLEQEVRAESLYRLGDPVGPLMKQFQVDLWVDYIPGSENDIDANEVNSQNINPKCVLRSEVFQPGWLEQNVPYFGQGSAASVAGAPFSASPHAAYPMPGATPPPPPPGFGGGIQFQDAGTGWLTPTQSGQSVRLGWHAGQAYWLVGNAPPQLAVQVLQAAQTPPPPGTGIVWMPDASGWQMPFWQVAPGVPPTPAQLGWYGNPLSPTPCWIVGGQTMAFTLTAAAVATPPAPPTGFPPLPPTS
jgi:hypothetical protein